jgi:hypothetical protein
VWQPIGYAYLTDEGSLELRHIDPDRDYDGRPGDTAVPSGARTAA